MQTSLILDIFDSVVHGMPMSAKLMERARTSEAAIYDKTATARFCDALERAATSYSVGELFKLALARSEPEADGRPASSSASLRGFIEMVRTVCDVQGGLSDDELRHYFEIVDTSRDGRLDLGEFEAILEVLRKAGQDEQAAMEKKMVEGPAATGAGGGR